MTQRYHSSQAEEAQNMSTRNLQQVPKLTLQNEANGASNLQTTKAAELLHDFDGKPIEMHANTRKHSRLNLSMQFDSKDLNKFGRYVDQFFCDKDKLDVRKGQSIDFRQGQLTALMSAKNGMAGEPARAASKSNTKTPPL